MPTLSLVVCVQSQRDLLDRLLQKAQGCYDELLIVHDGPDTFAVKEIADRFHGRWFEAPLAGSLEAQSPFAWARSTYDWILRLDADEFPSEKMKEWIFRFRQAAEPEPSISGYTCVWPIWDGLRAVTKHWPAGRIFLFNRRRVRFFGQIEQTPIPDGRYEALPLILHHQPARRSHGLRNVIFRKQAYAWRNLIARGLLGKPTDLPCWRWDSAIWPERWEEIRRSPLRTAFSRLVMDSLRTFRDQWKNERRILFNTGINGPIHHALICFEYWRLRRRQKSERSERQVTNQSE